MLPFGIVGVAECLQGHLSSIYLPWPMSTSSFEKLLNNLAVAVHKKGYQVEVCDVTA